MHTTDTARGSPLQSLRSLVAAIGLALGTPALAAPSLWISDDAAHLGRVDLASGTVSVIGDMGVYMTDIAFDAQGRLFGVTFESALFRIDPSNGVSSIIGELGVGRVNSLVFAPDGTLYAASDTLYTVNTGTGAATAVGKGGTPYQSSGDLAFVNGVLYLSGHGAGNSGDLLLQLNTHTGAADVVGRIGLNAVFGLATDNSAALYAVANTGIYSLNPVTAQALHLLDYAGQGLGNAFGTTFITEALPTTPVPELPPLPMLLAGLGCMWWLNRRRAG